MRTVLVPSSITGDCRRKKIITYTKPFLMESPTAGALPVTKDFLATDIPKTGFQKFTGAAAAEIGSWPISKKFQRFQGEASEAIKSAVPLALPFGVGPSAFIFMPKEAYAKVPAPLRIWSETLGGHPSSHMLNTSGGQFLDL